MKKRHFATLFPAMVIGAWSFDAIAIPQSASAQEAKQQTNATTGVDPVPITRDDIKRVLDASKTSKPRLPAPPLTDAEKVYIQSQKDAEKETGEKPRRYGLANNARTRAYYLGEYGFSIASDVDRAKTGANNNPSTDTGIDPSFRVMLFWIVSRGNNCTYCLGHQESGLAHRGLSDDELAALDVDWSVFDDAKRAAFEFARKSSFAPYTLGDADIEALRKYYSDAQIAELSMTIANFNATNRWTGPMRIQQDVLFEFTRPTSEKYVKSLSFYAPAKAYIPSGLAAPHFRERPKLESWSEMENKLSLARKRTPRLPLADEAATAQVLKDKELPKELASKQWVQLLAATPKSGADRLASYIATFEKGTLDLRSKAIISYVAARHDRAWYALAHAIDRLHKLGMNDEAIAKLDNEETAASPEDAVLIRFARTIATDPAMISDADFAAMQKVMGDKKVAEADYVVTQAAFFNRLTEAAGLQIEQ